MARAAWPSGDSLGLTRRALLGWARAYDREYRQTVWARAESDLKRAIRRRRAEGRPYLTPRLLALLAEWKTPRIRGRIARNPVGAVRRATGLAFAGRGAAARLGPLLALDGVGLPVASVILHFAFPTRYPILDVYVTTALGALGRLPRAPASPAAWPSYCEALRALAREHRVSLRTLDKALWALGRELTTRGRTPGPRGSPRRPAGGEGWGRGPSPGGSKGGSPPWARGDSERSERQRGGAPMGSALRPEAPRRDGV